jgi:hypothetical protein
VRVLLAIAILLLTASTAHAADAVPTALPAPPASEREPNDTAATATPIEPGARVRGSLMSASEVDVYEGGAVAFLAALLAGGVANDFIVADDSGATTFARHPWRE